MPMVSEATVEQYRIRRLDEVFPMAQYLAQYFDNHADIVTGIHELLVNAIEHGNLSIGHALKTKLLKLGEWETEIAKRVAMEKYASRSVFITLTIDVSILTLSICDDGDGFDWPYFINQDVSDAVSHGRGLRMARQCGFTSMMFNARGNEVICRGVVASHRPHLSDAFASVSVHKTTVTNIPQVV